MDEASELIKLAVEIGQFPKHLYRFRQLDSFFNRILENDEMWFSQPSFFNDPFDCKSNLDHSYTETLFLDFMNRYDMSIPHARLVWDSYSKNPNKLEEHVQRILDNSINSSYICCFTEEINNLLLWSHYAAGHTGACLKFDITKDTDFFTYPVRIKYSTTYPRNNYFEDDKKTIDDILTTKSVDWGYEKEIRVVKRVSNQNNILFEKQALVEIIFGCKTSIEKINEIKELTFRCGYTHVNFQKAILDSDMYRLNFELI